MNKFKIKVARIEAAQRGKQDRQVCITFQIDRATINFRVPMHLSIKDFDDTEMIFEQHEVLLHRMFVELASQSQNWKLTANDLRQLSSMSARPKR